MPVAGLPFALGGRSMSRGGARRFAGRVLFAASVCAGVCLPGAVAEAASFSYTGGEQTYAVPAGFSNVQITAIGGAGGAPSSGLPVGGERS